MIDSNIKVGDKIRITAKIFAEPYEQGSIHEVIEIKPWFAAVPGITSQGYRVDNTQMRFHSSEVEKVI